MINFNSISLEDNLVCVGFFHSVCDTYACDIKIVLFFIKLKLYIYINSKIFYLVRNNNIPYVLYYLIAPPIISHLCSTRTINIYSFAN